MKTNIKKQKAQGVRLNAFNKLKVLTKSREDFFILPWFAEIFALRLTPYALRLTPYALRLTPYALSVRRKALSVKR